MPPKRTVAPRHLGKTAAAFYRHVVDSFHLDKHHIQILIRACEALDRCEAAREAIAEHGLIYTDVHGNPRKRPEVSIEADSRLAFLRCCRELRLYDVVPAEEYTRPPRFGRTA